MGVKVEFSLADLGNVSENSSYIELSFGEKGLTTLPVRAFASEAEKAAFLAAVEAEPKRLKTATGEA